MGETKPSARSWLVALAIAAELSFVVYFFSLDLPNSGPFTARVSRLYVWQVSIGASDEPVPALEALKAVLGVDWIPERGRVILFALLVFASSIALGHALLHVLGFPHPSPQPLSPGGEGGGAGVRGSLTPGERIVFAYGLGSSALTIATLGLGLAGLMNRAVVLIGLATLCCIVAGWVIWWQRRVSRSSGGRTAESAAAGKSAETAVRTGIPRIGRVAGAVAIASFLVISLLGALLPATDFDVREYHLQGPKEFFQAGRIHFVPHNVYANMPFATEMMHLLGMIIAGDWWWGALVGQVVLAGFVPMTALGIAALGRRLFCREAGWFAALIYVTTPWVYRISIIPYTENALCFFMVSSTLAVVCACQQGGGVRLWCIAGALAGSAASCKYPALVSTVLPIGLSAFLVPAMRRVFGAPVSPCGAGVVRAVCAVTVGVVLTFGPWFAKNVALTGNPLYPLLYRLLDGRNWTAEKNEKWEWGHRVSLLVLAGLQRPPHGASHHALDPQTSISLRRLKENLIDVTAQADWQSPLVFGFAVLALLFPGRRREAVVLWLFVGFLFLQWWLLTHRLDRFWVPLLPIASVLAGAGVVWTDNLHWRRVAGIVVVVCVFYNFSFSTTGLCGDNRYAAKLEARHDPIDGTTNWLNANLPADAKVLAVGAADLFHLDRPLVYNTVFDDCIFEQWVGERDRARDNLQRHGITHVLVAWREIERYRQPGSYGYTEFVQPEVFRELERMGILRRMNAFGAIVDTVDDNRNQLPASELYAVIVQR